MDKARKIRDEVIERLDELTPKCLPYATAGILAEIAAQLAELNANLVAIFQAEDPDHRAPRLQVERME